MGGEVLNQVREIDYSSDIKTNHTLSYLSQLRAKINTNFKLSILKSNE